MAENSEKLGLLLLFDIVAVIIATFGMLLVFGLFSDKNMLILSCFFVGIKILVMGIGDITAISRKFWAAMLFVLLADIIIIAVNYFMAFGISMRVLALTAAVDIVLVCAAHLIWAKVFGTAYSAARERKDWLDGEAQEEETTEDEYDDIFASLVTKDGNTDALDVQAVNEQLANTEKEGVAVDFEEVAFVKTTLEEDDTQAESAYLDEEAFKNLLVNTDEEEPETVEEEAVITPEEEAEEVDSQEKPEEAVEETITEEDPIAEEEPLAMVEAETEEAPVCDEEAAEEETPDDLPEEDNSDLAEVAKNLGNLIAAIGSSTTDTDTLNQKITSFKADLEALTPITTESDIVESGEVIREKLKAIIDKQFIVDDVLEDLVRLSKQVNQRIDDLDTIEEDLKRRKAVLDQKELLFMDRKPKDFEDVDVQILPEEILLENDESEIIIDQGDLDAIKNYLSSHPEI